MRASFPHSLSARSAAGRRGVKHAAQTLRRKPVSKSPDPTPDPALKRAHEAGGPVDRALYTCDCGYAFAAPVSASVACPVCGCSQAW